MPTYPTKPDAPIPAFQSYEEEAAWFDDPDNFAKAWESAHPATLHMSKHLLAKPTQVRFDRESDRALEALAHERGLKKPTLIRLWVLERLRQERDVQRNIS